MKCSSPLPELGHAINLSEITPTLVQYAAGFGGLGPQRVCPFQGDRSKWCGR